MHELVVLFDAGSHPADAIQRASYKFADRFSVELTRDNDLFRCQLFFSDVPDDEMVAAFRVEVVDQVLRARIRDETEGVRNAVLALAFSNTGLSDE